MRSSYYQATIQQFISADKDSILGQLAQHHDMELDPLQKNIWIQQIEILKRATPELTGSIFFEFSIPRMGKRADNILFLGSTILVIEFKLGSQTASASARAQVMDYALDLKNFHAGTRHLTVVPLLVVSKLENTSGLAGKYSDGVYDVLTTDLENLPRALQDFARNAHPGCMDAKTWADSGYRPTPTIIQASQALYAGHAVEEITRSEAGADNLGATSKALSLIIERSKQANQKSICFITGVPGSGKTLAGLNLANLRRNSVAGGEEHAVFLSGNGPLVNVLQEALARDEAMRTKALTGKSNKSAALRKTKAFIQNIHHFRDDCLDPNIVPLERVVVFDEAQRAWDLHQTRKFMEQKRGKMDFQESEPAFLIGAMGRHSGWAVIVCLVGGGQEINTGEAGLEEWIKSLVVKYPEWQVYVSTNLAGPDYVSMDLLNQLGNRLNFADNLHLSVSLRSFRAERVSQGIGALLTGKEEEAKQELLAITDQYPIAITRSIASAKQWIRQQARGTERFGLLVSSKAVRLKALGVNVKADIDPCHWFLNAPTDVRSSYYLEDAATEFEVQGLELDWAIVIWDGNLVRSGSDWHCQEFRGFRWEQMQDEQRRRYLINSYRVLLTRARQGLAIVVPPGDDLDPTRPAAFFDPTWAYLKSLGLREVSLDV